MSEEIQKGINNILDKQYWDNRYIHNNFGWDLGSVAPILKIYFDKISDKSTKILIPGCGNAYEAAYLLELGFTDVTLIDIAPSLVSELKKRFSTNLNINIILGDFFEHEGVYDLIVEQTFFCALPPKLRISYVQKMHSLLRDNGVICGLLFDRFFEGGPPFGGDREEYVFLFKDRFELDILEKCTQSVPPRMGSELFFEFRKN